MKTITQAFKNEIKQFGRELDSIVTYELNGDTIELGNEQLNSVSPHYEGAILKSVMKVLELDSNEDIPLETIINYQFGVKVRNDVVQDYRDNYDYINFGNYVVYKSEKQEDTNSYKILCYDKMLYSMKDYEALEITYPITINNYIKTIADYMGLTFANYNETYANYNQQIPGELYLDSEGNSLGYTFRDVLDELAEVTASTICINEDDELEIRYIINTGDTIDEEYLKDINVNFGEQYGPVNTIILSRSAGADKIYISYPSDLPDEDKISIEISDNQIMNGNNRDAYLSDILNKLLGLQYYINDFSSTGICYYNVCDRYNVLIGENTYSCVMFNDDVQITTGLIENIHTDIPEESITDYTKADTTDRRINQTYLIVDKQNQTIESVISNVGEQDEKISQITQTVDELNSKISDIADVTVSNESSYATFDIENINQSEPIMIKIHPIVENISNNYPTNNRYPTTQAYAEQIGLKPSNTLTPNASLTPHSGWDAQGIIYPKTRILRFENLTDNTIIDYELPDDLLYYDADNYDEFYLDYDSQTCQITKKCEYDANHRVVLLGTSRIDTYTYPSIPLTDGDYRLTIIGNTMGYLFGRLMAKNIYTSQYATKVELSSAISQSASSIDLSVDQKLTSYSTTTEMNSAINIKANEINQTVSQKVGNNEIISKINQTPEQITINASKLNLTGYVTASDLSGTGTTVINGSNITTGSINANLITSGSLSANRISGGTINGNNVTVTNINASNITTGTINGRPYSYTSSSNGRVNLGDNSDGPIMGYRGSTKSWSIAAFTTGGRFQTFDSSGNMAAYFNQTGAHTSSDIRYKRHIENIEQEKSIKIITNLTPITYDYNDNSYHRGLSAQEVEKVLKENEIENQIYEIDKNDRYSLNYTELIPDLINCIKYQQIQIEDLQKRIEKLERESD